MRPLFLILLIAGAGIIAWLVLSRPEKNEPVAKQQAIAVSRHSETFNNSINQVLGEYNKLAEQFVNWDSVAAGNTATAFTHAIDSLRVDELKKDSSAIYETALMFVDNAKANAQTIASERGIRQQREAFSEMTDNLYQLLNTVNYDQQTIYLQECPMAFDDTETAQWLSKEKEIRNPYLGLYHPRYGKGMLACGETKTTLTSNSNN